MIAPLPARARMNPQGARIGTLERQARDWWNSRGFIAAALLLTALPLLWPTIPPLIDLPSHMGSYRIALALDSSPTLRHYFDFHWQVLGNLGVELIVMPLARMVGLELATKLIVILIVTLTAAGMMAIAREVHGELPPTLGFALPLAYGYPLHFGFLNYCLSMALTFMALALWLRLGAKRRWVLRAAVFAAIAPVVWLAHAIGWALLAIACTGVELHRRIELGERWPRVLLGSAASCATLAAPVLLMLAFPTHVPLSVEGWLMPTELAKWFATLFRDRWIALDLATLAVFWIVVFAAIARRGGMALRAALVWPALALLLTFVLAPRGISGSGFVNGRIAPYALALLALAIGTTRASPLQRQRLALAAAAFFAVRVAATTTSMALYSASYDANLKALDFIRPGSAVAAFSPVACEQRLANWWNPRLYHLPSMAIVRKDAFVNSEWQLGGLQMLRVKYAAAAPYDSDPSQIITLGCDVNGFRQYGTAMANFPREAFDNLWLLAIPRRAWPSDPDLKLVWSEGDSALYRIDHSARQPAH